MYKHEGTMVVVRSLGIGLFMLVSACTAPPDPAGDGANAEASYESKRATQFEGSLLYFPVAHVDRSVKFYRNVLGLPLIIQKPLWADFDIGGGQQLGLEGNGGAQVPRVPRDANNALAGGIIMLKTRNIVEVHRKWSAAGVHFLSPLITHPWGIHTAFEDPDGNVLNVVQPPVRKRG
jgi:catechol 2,3-dioxygenase-like lactoylglutathione lyase family enzyme